MTLDLIFFYLKFENPDDYRFALCEGPWFIGGHYLSMRRWSPNLKPSEASIHTTLVCARLPELPLEYFDKSVLDKVGAKLGRLIKVDTTTELVLRGRFARVCVEVSTDKPLVPLVKIGPIKQKIEYEGVNLICFHCGKLSHKKDNCPKIVHESNGVHNTINVAGEKISEENVLGGKDRPVNEEESFGSWMLVEKKKNKARGNGTRISNHMVQDNKINSRFNSLDA